MDDDPADMSVTSCALAVFSLSIVGFSENTLSCKKPHMNESNAFKLKEYRKPMRRLLSG